MIFRKKTIEFPAWNYTVVVVITTSFDAAAHRLNLEGPKKYDDETTGGVCCHETDNGQSFLFVKPNANVNVIAHESWHCINRMLEYAGAELDSETVAYHLGYLAGQVHEFIHRRRKNV